MAFNLSTGSVARTFELPFTTSAGRSIKLRLGTPICFEVAYDRSCRRLVVDESGERRVDFLVNVSNDGWFHNSRVGRELFLLSARWRAAELGTPILRVANTGISCVIDANGSVLHRRLDSDKDAIFSEGVMTAEMPFAQVGLPVYASIGPMLLLLMGFGGVGAVVLGVVAGPWPRVRWRRGKKM
jgi:apolipoprotein N-acyltransferase